MCSTFLIVGLAASIIIGVQASNSCDLPPRGNPYFPKNFSFGVATAAYQVEGGWNADGKGPSIWDDFTHNYPHLIHGGSTGDIAADSYHRFDQDLLALKELKGDMTAQSVAFHSWPLGKNCSEACKRTGKCSIGINQNDSSYPE